MGMTTHSSGDRPHVLVLGAGYAGLMAALRLAPHARVSLVDPSDRFTERVRLHELAAGVRPDVSHPLSHFLRPAGIEHIAARATGIDPATRTVTTDDGRRLPYDRLVYALGSRTAPVGERAHTAETAAGLSKRLQDGPGSVAVVGGGLTGIELAAELAESRPEWRVSLHSEGRVGSGFTPRARDHALGVLRARGVRIEQGRRIAEPDSVDADEVVWAASMVPNTELAAAAGLPLDPRAASGSTAPCARRRSPRCMSRGTPPRRVRPGPARCAWPARPPCPWARTRPPRSSPSSADGSRAPSTTAS
ncbi:NAD(P)/FAD-dependent oxidoreductase [Streptomyces sp. PKU-MA01144]|uniref:NAD(P)/FAD-dependent oxidoreductase n=1 Tax=Streptomyces sp. PKU-MA01144 TaxID=2729138 RepID=UPI0027962070|nr:FAD-dependent oxidoreductase [Streptomyces sp. PKU-MA01144]